MKTSTDRLSRLIRRSGPRGRGDRHGCGFTMVELMTVVAVIALLMAILIPSLMQIKTQIQRSAALATVRLLDSAVKAYHSDFEDYPPSSTHDDDYGYLPAGWDGKFLLPLFLTGYAPDAKPADEAGVPFEEGVFMDHDDGKAEFGFRVVARGRVYGPYNGAENVRMEPPEETGDPPAFYDSFGSQVFYYRFDEENETYQADHNGPDTYGPRGDQQPDMPDYARRDDGAFFRRDFILCTKGPDYKFEAFSENTATDDVTNFLQEQ